MKTLKTLLLIVVSISLLSCANDDDPTSPLCLNTKFYGLRVPDNQSHLIDLVSNSSANIGSSNVNVLSTSSFPRQLVPNRATYDFISDTYVYLNRWNNATNEIIRSVGLSGLSNVNLSPTTSEYDGLVSYNGNFYALEKTNTGAVYFVSINVLTGATNRITATDISSSISLSNPISAGNNICYAASDENGMLYFLSNNLIAIDEASGNLIQTFTPPATTSFTYLDIVKTDDASGIDGLFVAKADGGFNGLVHWELDITSGTIAENPIISGLDFNPETTDLTFNDCGDRLLAMSNYGFSGGYSKFYDIQVPNNPHLPASANQGNLVGTRIFSELFVGIANF